MQSDAAVKKQDDEQAIREMVDTWLEASKRGDTATLRNLLADDVLFITPGKEPFGKDEFAAANPAGSMKDIKMEAAIDIKEIEVVGPWAWMHSFLRLSFCLIGTHWSKMRHNEGAEPTSLGCVSLRVVRLPAKDRDERSGLHASSRGVTVRRKDAGARDSET